MKKISRKLLACNLFGFASFLLAANTGLGVSGFRVPQPTTKKLGIRTEQKRPPVPLLFSAASEPSLSATSTKAQNVRGGFLPIFSRPHERGIYLFYTVTCLGTSILLNSQSLVDQKLIESGIALVWSSFILAISFLEAWVKFKAPFLRTYIAVDVGRHVFAALNAAELAFATSFWIGRLTFAKEYFINKRLILPCMATFALLTEVLFIQPKMSLRTKTKIVNGLESSVDTLTDEERTELKNLKNEVIGKSPLPSRKWHSVYALLELVKVVCLKSYVLFSCRK